MNILAFFNDSMDYLVVSLVVSFIISLVTLVIVVKNMKIHKENKINLSYINGERSQVKKIKDKYLYTR